MGTLLITQTFTPRVGGRELYLDRVLRGLGPDLTVVTPLDGDTSEFDRLYPGRVHRVDAERWEWFDRGRRGRACWLAFLGWLCLAGRVRTVQCATVLPEGLTGLLLKRVFGLPYVVYAFGLDVNEQLLDVRRRQQALAVLDMADRVIACSEYTRRQVVDLGVSPERVVVVHPGVDADSFAAATDEGREVKVRHGLAGKRVILTVGRLVSRKGQDRVIQAMPSVLNRVPNAVYLIVGDGPDRRRLEALAQAVGVRAHVIFAGRVDRSPGYYQTADVFVMPSREIADKGDVEGFGIVFLEAGAAGKPVVGGRSGGVLDAIVHGETGFLVDPEDCSELAGLVVDLLTHPDLAARLGANGKARVLGDFTWDAAERRVSEVVRDVGRDASPSILPLGQPARASRLLRTLITRS